ncbi:MAG: glycosyltransferase family 2 protein [Anaerolineae bacterium]
MMGVAGWPLVSIVTPSLNQGRFIANTIESVLSQDYPRIEYFVVDGGSTDETLEVLHRYRGRLRWVSEPDGGQSAAVNKGWRQTSGEIVAWLNSDDTYLPGAVSQVVAFLQEHPEIDAVYGNCDYIDLEGRFLRPYPTRPYNYLELVRTAFNYIPQPATFVRRQALEAIGYLDETLHYIMDLDCWLRLGAQHTLAYLPVRLATLRLHPQAKSVHRIGGFAAEFIYVYQRLFALPHLPATVRAIETEAMSNVYYLAAYFAFWAGDLQSARRYGLRAWRLRPFRVRRLLPFLALGKPGLKLAQALRGHPCDNTTGSW